MLKEFAQYLVSLKENKTYDIHGDTYSDRDLVRIEPHIDRPTSISVSGLDSIVKLVRNEMDMLTNLPVFIRVDGANRVVVFTTYDDVMRRDSLYIAECDVPGFRDGFREYEKAIIELRSKFAPGPGVDYYLYITPTLLGMTKDLDLTKSKEVLEGFAKVVKVPQNRFYTAIAQRSGKAGEEAGGYTKAAAVYQLTDDTSAADGKTYYEKSGTSYSAKTPTSNPKTEGLYEMVSGAAKKINFMIVHKSAIIQFTKHVAPKIIEPSVNQTADAYKFGYRKVGIADAYENKVAGIYLHKAAD